MRLRSTARLAIDRNFDSNSTSEIYLRCAKKGKHYRQEVLRLTIDLRKNHNSQGRGTGDGGRKTGSCMGDIAHPCPPAPTFCQTETVLCFIYILFLRTAPSDLIASQLCSVYIYIALGWTMKTWTSNISTTIAASGKLSKIYQVVTHDLEFNHNTYRNKIGSFILPRY